MRVRPMRPEKTMHRAEHRVGDIAINAGKAHSLLVDSVFPYAFGRFLSFLSLGPRCHFGVVAKSPCDIAMDHRVEVKHRNRHGVLLGD